MLSPLVEIKSHLPENQYHNYYSKLQSIVPVIKNIARIYFVSDLLLRFFFRIV